MSAPRFPPLFEGRAAEGATDPFAKACAEAALGCDAGLIVYNIGADRLAAAMVFAPEMPLGEAMVALPLAGVGFQNALGALAPPEVAVHLTWAGGIHVNGAACGRLRAAASTTDPAAVPDWLVVGLALDLLPAGDAAPGLAPDRTSLFEEGCVDVAPATLLEAWARHTLVWLNLWESEGTAKLHGEWQGLVPEIGAEVAEGGRSGVFLGTDERFGMLLRDGEGTHLVPLTTLLDRGESR